MRHAQISQMFVFILAVIVIGSTIYIGMRLFSDFKDTGCETLKARFMQDMNDIIEDSSPYGSRAIESVRPSCDARELCFVSSDAIGDAEKSAMITDESIKMSVSSGVKTNMFIRDNVGLQPMGYDERIKIDNPYFLCANAGNSGFTFKTEGKGNAIVISDAMSGS
jgi:hypothetical protein